MKESKNTYSYLFIAVISILALIAFPETTSKLSAVESAPHEGEAFKNISLEAKSAYVYDLSSHKPLFSKNDQDVLPLASLTKIMTTLTAASLAPHSEIFSMRGHYIRSGVENGGLFIERWSLADLLRYTLVVSSNDAATAIAAAVGITPHTVKDNAEKAFVEKMNENAKNLGLDRTRFFNPTGLDIEEASNTAGAEGTAKDVARMLEQGIVNYPEIFGATKYESVELTSVTGQYHTAKNTNALASKIPGLIAGKTGYTELAGGNLAVVFDAGLQHPVIIVVLGSSYEGRFEDIDKLIAASIDTIARE